MKFKLVWKDPRKSDKLIETDNLKKLIRELEDLINEDYDKLNVALAREEYEASNPDDDYDEYYYSVYEYPPIRYYFRGSVDVYYKGKIIGMFQINVYCYWQWAEGSSKLSPAIFHFFDPMGEHQSFVEFDKMDKYNKTDSGPRKATNVYLDYIEEV